MTSYVVLHRDPPEGEDDSGPNVWSEVVVTDAASADAAIRKVAPEQGSGLYQAVSVRSWKPRRVNVAQITKVDLS